MVVSDSRHQADRDALGTWGRKEHVVSAATCDAALEALTGGNARLVVSDMDKWPPGTARQFARSLKAGADAAPLVLRTDLTAQALMELPLLAEELTTQPVWVSFRQHEPLEDLLNSASIAGPLCATFDILRATLRFVPPLGQAAFGATVVACRRKVLRGEVHGALGMGKDKLRRIYNACGLPSFSTINAELLAAHVVAGAERGLSAEACAWRAGFADVGALDKYLNYHFSQGLEAIRRDGGLAVRLESIVAWFGGAADP